MRKISTLLLACVLMLVSLGIVMIASTSSVVEGTADPQYYVKRQAVWLCISVVIALLCYKRDYHTFEKRVIPLIAITLLALVLVRIPHIGSRINGSWRWLRVGSFSFQPSELAKLATLVGLSAWMSRVEAEAGTFKKGFLFPIAGLGFIACLVLVEPDFGTTLLLGVSGWLVMLAAGSPLFYLLGSGAVGAALFTVIALHNPNRRERMLAFLDPAAHPQAAYHLIQSKTAFIRGNWFGVGLGNSIQKQHYLPEAHTDFILPIIGEELGFVTALGVLIIFAVIMFCGIRIALRAVDRFGKLLAFGITMLVTVQAAINIAVVTGAMPTKGLPLPFISYGGSSMMISLACMGILLNIAGQVPHEDAESDKVIKNKARRL